MSIRCMGIALVWLTVASQVVSGNEHGVVDEVAFVRHGAPKESVATEPITHVSRGAHGKWGVLEFRATIRPSADAGNDDYIVVASIEACVARRALSGVLEGKDPVEMVSWGYIPTMRSVASVVLESVSPMSSRIVQPISLDIDEVLQDKFGEPDETLWPWAFRVTVYVLDRYARVIGKNNAVVRIEPG